MMTPVKRRAYTSAVRDEQAARTRARILDAAVSLFESQGFVATSINAIAQRAEVAVDTVYATYGSKERVLTAVVDHRLRAGTGVANLLERPEALAIRDEPDQRQQLRQFAQLVAGVWSAVGPVYEILRTATAAGPKLAALHKEMDGYRLLNMRQVAEWIAARGPLRVDVDRAGEVIWTIASPDVSKLLRDGRGWTEDEHAAWLEDSLARTLLPDGERSTRRRSGAKRR